MHSSANSPHHSPDSTDSSASSAASRPAAGPLSGHPLRRYGWDAGVADAFAPYDDQGLVPGRVVRVDRGRCDVATEQGVVTAAVDHVWPSAATDDPTRAVCTGDWAALRLPPPGPAQVRALLPRRTAFLRSTATRRSEGQVLAANVDHALIAVPLSGDLDLSRVERFTALAWAGGARPLLVLTKSDLALDAAELAGLVQDVEQTAPGVPVLAVSSATGDGLDAVRAVVAGGTCVLLGQSGAGKSTLANALLGEEAQTVRATRDSDGKGRHTTTARDLLPLPEELGGGVLIDTPGLRGVGLWDAGGGIGRAFPDVEELAADCRFHDCRHESEPDCAVHAALEEGRLPHRRLESYRKLRRENSRLAARTDARLRAEQKRRVKQADALERHVADRRRGGRRER